MLEPLMCLRAALSVFNLVVWLWEMPVAVGQWGRRKGYQMDPYSCSVYIYSLQLQYACTYNTVGMPGKGNKGITPSPNNAYTSPK